MSVPPNLSVSRAVNAIKGRSAYKLLAEFRTLKKAFYGGHLWARGYFVATSGNVTDEVVAEYIANQHIEPVEEDFNVTE